jgi:hypothetical protein
MVLSTHHCPAGGHVRTSHCVKAEHVVECEEHPGIFIRRRPPGECCQCDAMEQRRSRALFKEDEAKRKAEEAKKKEEEEMSKHDLKNRERERKREEQEARRAQRERSENLCSGKGNGKDSA